MIRGVRRQKVVVPDGYFTWPARSRARWESLIRALNGFLARRGRSERYL